MWLLKTVDYFVGGVGTEVFSQKFKHISVFFGICNDISNHFYFHYLGLVDCQQSIYFSAMHHKTCGHKIDEERLNLLLSLVHQKNPPFVDYEPKPNIY